MTIPAMIIAAVSSFLLLEVPASTNNPTDLKITIRHTLGTGSISTTEYLSGNLSRQELQPFSGGTYGHRRAIIRRRGEDQIQVFDLDLEAHEYVTYETTLLGTSLKAKGRRMEFSGGTIQIFSDSVDTGERKEMFGHVARHIVTKVRRIAGPGACSSSSGHETDGWYIDYDALPEWRRPKKGVFHVVLGLNCTGKRDKIDVHRSGPEPGYPLKLTTTSRDESTLADGCTKVFTSTSEMEVVEFSQAPLDPALFEVPSGFRKVHKLAEETQAAQTFPRAVWQWLKNTWDDLFE